MQYIKNFREISLKDGFLVGGKNASLGEMIQQLSTKNIAVPEGFAITTDAYHWYIKHNNFFDRMRDCMKGIDKDSPLRVILKAGSNIRSLLQSGEIPQDVVQEITRAYNDLSSFYNTADCSVAVRSSATTEDLPTASYAGQHETFLHVVGIKSLLFFYKQSVASLFTDRAIAYRFQKGLDPFAGALSVGIQKMVRSDSGSAGTAFTLDTESGFSDVVVINAAWGLGEIVVKGEVKPDEFCVYKPLLLEGFKPIIKKECGTKNKKIILDKNGVVMVETSLLEQQSFCLSDTDILAITGMSIEIEKHYSLHNKERVAMDIEWAKDGIDGVIYIVQARPETIHTQNTKKPTSCVQYSLGVDQSDLQKKIIVQGSSIGQSVATGKVRLIESLDANSLDSFCIGDILVTAMTDPDWVPLMKKAAALITQEGGRTSHAAIVSRELAIPAVVGASGALTLLHNGQEITVDCSQGQRGLVFDGIIPIVKKELHLDSLPSLPFKLFLNCADPQGAFRASFLPVDGVGLARLEFIISSIIGIHPMAVIEPEKITNAKIREKINELSSAYQDPMKFFVDVLAQGIGMIAAAFYPRPTIVRFSDFKSNEYRNLIAGEFFEKKEENPMLGLRGASRYYSPQYQKAFELECAAINKVRNEMGFINVHLMVPFVRTVQEAEKVLVILANNALIKRTNSLEIYMMCEIPSNVILIDEFSSHFDGFSIGSNDLTQTTLAVDRDSVALATLFNEQDEAVKRMFSLAIQGAKRNKKHSGICGQAPSDYPEIADFLIQEGIDSLSLNVDSVIPFLLRYINVNR